MFKQPFQRGKINSNRGSSMMKTKNVIDHFELKHKSVMDNGNQ